MPTATSGEQQDVIKICPCIGRKCHMVRRTQACLLFLLATGLSVTLLTHRSSSLLWSRSYLATVGGTLTQFTIDTADSSLNLSSNPRRVAAEVALSSSGPRSTPGLEPTQPTSPETPGRQQRDRWMPSTTDPQFPETTPPPRTVSASDDPRWLPLDRNHNETYVYAAYFDDVERDSYVRLLVSSLGGKINLTVRCLYFKSAGRGYQQPLAMTQGRLVSYHPWHNGNSYTGSFAKCPLPKELPRPEAVSIVNSSCDDVSTCNSDVSTVLHVHYGVTEAVGKPKWNVTRCFPAMFGYKNVMELIQQVEVSRSLGVEHFLFYNFSISLDVNRVLQYYIQRGEAEVIDWYYPKPMYRSTYYDQDDAIQDCVHRNIHSSRYLLLGDLDEIIVPRKATSVLEVLEDLHAKRPNCGSFFFVNTFFLLNGALSEEEREKKAQTFPGYDFALKHKLSMLLVQHRVDQLWTDGQRAKPGLIPRRVEAGDVHSTRTHRPAEKNYTSCQVPVELALLHHYRHGVPWSLEGDYVKKHGIVPDRDLLRFAPGIVQRMRRAIRDLKDHVKFT